MTGRECRTARAVRSEGRNYTGGGSDRILVADQCAVVVAVTGRMLEILGYRVVTARSGAQALDVFDSCDSCGEVPGLVILDMTLFRCADQEIRNQLRRMSFQVPVLIWSAYLPDACVREFLGQGPNDYLQKPFEMDELAAKVRQLLGNF